MLLPSRSQLWIGLVALIVSAGCETQTDTAGQPAPNVDTLSTQPAPADTAAAPPVPEPDDNADNPSPSDAPRTTIPGVYHGRWDRSALACTQSSSELRLNVGATALNFYEGTSRVLAVRGAGSGIELDVEHTAEGMTDRRTYRLSTTGDELTVSINGHATTRVRCNG